MLFAGIIDRVAVVVGGQVITETEVQEEVRVTQFLNDEPLDLSPDQRRAAAERLVDQQLIRNDMTTGGYAQPAASEGDKMLTELKKERFHDNDQEYSAALARYGITEDQLKRHLLWQYAVVQFTDHRFGGGSQQNPEQAANRVRPGAQPPLESGVEQRLDAWLQDARGNTTIQFKKEAFQ